VGPVAAAVKIAGHKRQWPVLLPLPLALAAGLAIGWIVLPRRVDAPPQDPAPQVAMAPPTKPPIPLEPAPKVAQAAVRPEPRPPRARHPIPAAPRPHTIDFVALDDRPIDAGVVMRVSWGPENLQADIIFGPDGSARAYRLVNANFKY